MKKAFNALVILSLILISSCTDDSTIQKEEETAPLMGKWVLDRIIINEMTIDLNECDKNNYYLLDRDKISQQESISIGEECVEKTSEGIWKERNGSIIILFEQKREVITINDDQSEIEEFVDVTLPDGSVEERLYIFTKE